MNSLMEASFPFYVDADGLIAGATYDQHVRQMIEQLLFTAPGERVNRPDFGCGLAQLVFAAAGDQLITVTQATVLGELQRWLGDVIRAEAVQVKLEESTLFITVRYVLLRSGELREEQFKWQG